MKHILIVDDDVAVTNYFKVFIAQTGSFESTIVNDPRQVIPLFEKDEFDIVLLDLDMPHISGMDILHDMKKHGIHVPVLVLTGVSDVDLAVKSMKLGAFDYLVKPVEEDKLLAGINDALEHSVLHKSIDELPDTLTHKQLINKDAFEHLPTLDSEMIRLFHHAEKLADSDMSIFIWGETGTGKEDLARAIHHAGPRRDNPFIAVEAKCFEPEQFPASFFGQVRGWSGTREETPGFLDEANEGTLFLNHIERLNHPMQTRLLRVLQTNEYYRENSAVIRTVDVSIIVASTKNLTAPKYEDIFSRDLLYHLMINSIRIPPLRERSDDIPLLAEYFLRKEAKKAGKKMRGFSDECIAILRRYQYPNNVRELSTIVASAVTKAGKEMVCVDSLPIHIR